MQQVILTKPGKLEIRDVPVPVPSEGEIVVQINTALTCGTDLKAFTRGHEFIPMPGPFGHEYSGIIAKTGRGVKDFKEGENVMGVHSAPCLECGYCKKGLYNLCAVMMDSKALGAFSEYLLLPAHIVKQNLFHKPDNISFKEAAMLEPFSCVVHNYGKLKVDEAENALVIGAGPIGLMHLAYLNMRGIKFIISDMYEDRLSVAKKMGAEQVAGPFQNVEKLVMEATDNLGADMAIECTGRENVWEESVNYVRRGGAVVLFGGCPGGTRVSYDSYRLHYDELTITGSFHYTPQDVKNAYDMLTEKKVDLSALISGEFPLQSIEKAFNLLKEGRGIKYALKP